MSTARNKRAVILLNPSAGTGHAGENILDIVRRFADDGYEPILYPIVPGTDLTAEKILAGYDGRADIVLCSGGDGTLHHVMQGIIDMEEPPRIGYMPSGSTNDFAAALGIPSAFGKALDTALHGRPFAYDVGRLNERYFNYTAAFGAFSAISYDTDQQLKNRLGHAAYIISALTKLYQNITTRYHMRVETSDGVFEDDYIFGAVCNSISVGGFKMFRDVDVTLDDGRMELLLIRAPQYVTDLQGVVNALLRGTLNHPDIIFRQIRGAMITSDSEVPWALDGEFGGIHRDTSFSVIGHAVSIMIGR